MFFTIMEFTVEEKVLLFMVITLAFAKNETTQNINYDEGESKIGK